MSRSSRSCCTCGASSEPYAAVAIRQPPHSSDDSWGAVAGSSTSSIFFSPTISSTTTKANSVSWPVFRIFSNLIIVGPVWSSENVNFSKSPPTSALSVTRWISSLFWIMTNV